jgi:hypothetical protein
MARRNGDDPARANREASDAVEAAKRWASSSLR